MRAIENETTIGPWLFESDGSVVAQYQKFVDDEDDKDEDEAEAEAKGAISRSDIRDESKEALPTPIFVAMNISSNFQL